MAQCRTGVVKANVSNLCAPINGAFNMCNSVQCKGCVYSTPRDLAEIVGGIDNLIWVSSNPFVNLPADRDWHDLDLCLCPIDLEATLARAGLKWTRGIDPRNILCLKEQAKMIELVWIYENQDFRNAGVVMMNSRRS
jgi:hypothetical protein